ncbi:MAG TPA: DNA gyrase subunit A [Eubacterium sp.]|nr:DNA gyrase subunit A [Eubacterium sp.]
MQNDIVKELGTNFIEYAVAVNTDRSIPDAKSGLKPVARRILYGAYNTGRTSNKAHVKAARIVGDVMGSLHPHGDSSIYGALVRLSQDWVMRYPLIDFHGNNGNVIGDGPAHMRYTEARLSKIAEDGLLQGLKKGNVDFIPTYDEADEEPVTLPAIFPNLLCNPNEGIGVAMACKWAPHNLNEVAAAIGQYLNGEEPMLPGPDFPSGGIVINKNDIPNIMRTGHGSVKIRGKYKVEKNNIIFYEIPYGQTVEGLVTEIGQACEDGKIDGIDDVSDNTNKKGIRIVVECKRGANPDAIANKIYAHTNMQSSFSYNMVGLVGKTPTELNLKDCIKIYVDHNIECIVREAKFDRNKALARLEVVEGLLVALADIDNIIAIIKKSESSAAAKQALIEKYNFTDNQVTAILNMKLSSLAKLEGVKLENEKADLSKKIDELDELVRLEDKQIEELKRRLSAIVKKYGDARRTELAQIEVPKEEKEIELVEPEDVVVICTQSGDIKRVPKTSFKIQKRNGKGVKTQDDAILSSISTNTVDTLLIFTSEGRMFRMLVDNVPAGTNASRGTNLATLLKLNPNEKIMYVTSQFRETDAKYVVFFTKNGLIKKTKLDEFKNTKKTTGIQAIKFKDGDSLANVTLLNEEDVIILTKCGKGIKFETKDIAPIGRIAAGVKAIKLKEGDEVLVGLPISQRQNNDIGIFTISGLGKRVKTSDIPLQNRGGVGVIVSENSVAGGALINDSDHLLIIGRPNSICIEAKGISVMGRTAAGVQIVNGSKIERVIKL